MYSLTINFETKEALEKYLAGDKPKTAKVAKKTKAKPKAEKPVEEVPVEEPKVDPAKTLEAKKEAERNEALAEFKAFIDPKTAEHGMDAMVAMANAVKEQLGVNPSTSVSELPTGQIKLFGQELAIVVEDYELKKQKDAEGTKSLI